MSPGPFPQALQHRDHVSTLADGRVNPSPRRGPPTGQSLRQGPAVGHGRVTVVPSPCRPTWRRRRRRRFAAQLKSTAGPTYPAPCRQVHHTRLPTHVGPTTLLLPILTNRRTRQSRWSSATQPATCLSAGNDPGLVRPVHCHGCGLGVRF